MPRATPNALFVNPDLHPNVVVLEATKPPATRSTAEVLCKGIQSLESCLRSNSDCNKCRARKPPAPFAEERRKGRNPTSREVCAGDGKPRVRAPPGDVRCLGRDITGAARRGVDFGACAERGAQAEGGKGAQASTPKSRAGKRQPQATARPTKTLTTSTRVQHHAPHDDFIRPNCCVPSARGIQRKGREQPRALRQHLRHKCRCRWRSGEVEKGGRLSSLRGSRSAASTPLGFAGHNGGGIFRPAHSHWASLWESRIAKRNWPSGAHSAAPSPEAPQPPSAKTNLWEHFFSVAIH